MNSLKARLAAAKQRLRPTETHVLTPAGNELIERRDESGQSNSTIVGTNRYGFVVDTRPDMQLAEVESGLFFGGQDPAADAKQLNAYGITHIINCASMIECYFPDQFTYLQLEILDQPDADIRQHFDRSYHFIDTCLTMGGRCFVHCNAGVSRSVTICAAYLMRRRGMTLEQALTRMRRVRQYAQPNFGFMQQLRAYDLVLCAHREREERRRAQRASKQKLDEDAL